MHSSLSHISSLGRRRTLVANCVYEVMICEGSEALGELFRNGQSATRQARSISSPRLESVHAHQDVSQRNVVYP